MEAFTIALPAETGTPRLARRAVLERLADVPRRDDLLLCVSEVVTNAVLHAGTPKHLSVRPIGDVLLVEVADGDPRLPTRRAHDPTSATGRGLHFLDDLTVRWGARPTADGKVVWFEFALTDSPAPTDGPDATTGVGAIQSAAAGGPITVVAAPEVDLVNAPALRAELDAHIQVGARHLVVDLSACRFFDSSGVSVLVATHLGLVQQGGHLEVTGAHGAVASVLRLGGVEDLLSGGPS